MERDRIIGGMRRAERRLDEHLSRLHRGGLLDDGWMRGPSLLPGWSRGHLRTAFVDHPDPARSRHLLRSWLSLPNNRQLPANFAPFFGDTAAGALRGGYESRTGGHTFSTA